VARARLAAGLLLVALAVAVAYTTATVYAAGYQAAGNKTIHKAPAKPHPFYAATRHVVINGSKIYADLTVDVVSANASSIAGRVVYGTGMLTLGNATYTVKTAYGTLAKGAVKLMLYTGNSIILLQYRHGRYFAVVKPLGRPSAERFGGRATLEIQ